MALSFSPSLLCAPCSRAHPTTLLQGGGTYSTRFARPNPLVRFLIALGIACRSVSKARTISLCLALLLSCTKFCRVSPDGHDPTGKTQLRRSDEVPPFNWLTGPKA